MVVTLLIYAQYNLDDAEDYFYNTGQNTQDGKPVSNYNSGSTAPLDNKVYSTSNESDAESTIFINDIKADKIVDPRFKKGILDPRRPNIKDKFQPFDKYNSLHDLYCVNMGESPNSNLYRSFLVCQPEEFIDN
jgi:hypothetical protein